MSATDAGMQRVGYGFGPTRIDEIREWIARSKAYVPTDPDDLMGGFGIIDLECMIDETEWLLAQRDALLESLVEMVDRGEGCASGNECRAGCGCRYERARAAIANATKSTNPAASSATTEE